MPPFKSFIFIALVTIILFLKVHDSSAVLLKAKELDYDPQKGIYTATGNVRIEKDDMVLTADKVILYENTSEAFLEGSIIYQDREVIITSEKAQLNIETETGEIKEATIFFKKDNYWIYGKRILKTGVKSYYLFKATFTTCNTEPYLVPNKFPYNYFEKKEEKETKRPDWCFTGEDVYIEVGESLKAKNVTYNIKNFPILYSPFVWLPIHKERQSGFLIPIIGSSSKKGFRFSPAYFWAIDEDKDATFYFDYLSQRGLGKGIEFRYLDLTGLKRWQIYHLRDSIYQKDFFALKGDGFFSIRRLSGFVDVNYINDANFYKEYGYNSEGRITNLAGLSNINRFLQSSAEFNISFKDSRLYFGSQYWKELGNSNMKDVLKAPVIGYVMNPINMGPLIFSFNTSFINFNKDDELKGQRLLINPLISHSLGDSIRLLQSLSIIQTAYSFSLSNTQSSTTHRGTFTYKAEALSTFYKNYSNFTHNIDLSLGYKFSPKTKDLPIFDFLELIKETSMAEISILNSLRKKNLSAYLRIIQPYDFIENSLNPLIFQASIMSPSIIFRLETIQNFKKNRTERLNSFVHFKIDDTLSFHTAKRYSYDDDIKFLAFGFDKVLSPKLNISANMSYDGKGGGFREFLFKTYYQEQCWAINAFFSRKPGDSNRPSEYNFSFVIELKGIGKFKTL